MGEFFFDSLLSFEVAGGHSCPSKRIPTAWDSLVLSRNVCMRCSIVFSPDLVPRCRWRKCFH